MSKSKSSEKLIVEFLIKQNRPLSAQDVLGGLDGKIGKTEATRTLEELANDKKILEKIYGKQKVYMAIQNIDTTTIKSELRNLDEKIILSNSDLTRLKVENDKMESQLSAYRSKMPISDLNNKIAELNASIDEAKKRIRDLKSSNVPVISKEEKAKITKEFEKNTKLWRKLKRIATEMMATIMENCNMKKDQLCEDLGIILDEHEKVQPF